MRLQPSTISGCFLITPEMMTDRRGRFSKIFHCSTFRSAGLDHEFAEQFVTESGKGVLRGMHFQVPPYEQSKIVTCLAGEVLDVVVDLRRNSATFGAHHVFELDGESSNGVYVPRGLAHGFYVLQGPAVMHYSAATEYAPTADSGIHWNSIGYNWPTSNPTVSERDATFPQLSDFRSPF